MLKLDFQRNKVVSDKTCVMWKAHFVVPILLVLTLAFDKAVYGTFKKKLYPIFFKQKKKKKKKKKSSSFPENLIQSIKNVQHLQWMSHKTY